MSVAMFSSTHLNEMRRQAKVSFKPLASPHPPVVLFFSCSDGRARAQVITATGSSFESSWQKGMAAIRELALKLDRPLRWLRVDWPGEVHKVNWAGLRELLSSTKRNYFRLGLALDEGFSCAFLEQELNANAMLYGGKGIDTATLNEKNFLIYFRSRFPGLPEPDFCSGQPIYLFSGAGLFLDGDDIFPLHPTGLKAGRRVVGEAGIPLLSSLISDASRYLTRQVCPDGLFVYGYHPCFDRQINAYNTLRHASTTYAMIEAYELTQDEELRCAIERSLKKMTHDFIKQVDLADGTPAAFLTERNLEIKLGGNAVALLALAKHAQVFGTEANAALMARLAEGICFMQDRKSGAFRHVLMFPTLETREQYRTIYYEGEAAFALMRLYELTGDQKWLDSVEMAFGHFIANNYARHHDHWLGYCVNELTRYRPREEYFRFAIDNVADYLDFVATRITTFPTLLELMMATSQTLTRLNSLPGLRHLLGLVDLKKFEKALDKRVHHLLNGHFWPEYAMFMRNPERILGSFFIRHHAFRVRIDDVEHYLSGLIAYKAYLEKQILRRLGGGGESGPQRLATVA